ncbi:helix-turn-helix domain-containing protein [uncultured Trichococcus sp.]|uniref:helix-turn-helix domain-containing protein n=1 Tax=uncultured Trichococcus sp. TaxID=189665 RepID=UPI0029C8B494|nr:helix-turn-helix domain-containing protein [uncultured Trichococcus sp.]
MEILKSINVTEVSNAYIIFYLLKGNVALQVSGNSFHLKPLDVVMINPFECFQITNEDCLLVKFSIDTHELLRLTDYQTKYFACNTVKEKNEHFLKLKALLDRLIKSSFEQEYRNLLYQKNSFDLLSFLITKFSNNILIKNEEDARKDEIIAYIDANYKEDISLNAIADHFHLSPQYFSKYFKETFQTTFLKYVNSERIEAARIELLHSDTTILRIALDHGFPNLSSFARVFKEKYKMNPSQYRTLNQKVKIEDDVWEYSSVKPYLQGSNIDENESTHEIFINISNENEKLIPYWFNICNLGKLSQILNDGMKEQIVEVQNQIGFRYARINLDLFKFLSADYSYYDEEKALDFLIEMNFSLLFVIDFRTYHNEAGFRLYLKEMLNHFINRYGIKKIQSWKFELDYNTDYLDEKAREYAIFYDTLSSVFEEIGLTNKLMGPGLLLDDEGNNLKRFLKFNTNLETLTLTVAPYSIENKDGNILISRTTDSNYIFEQYELARSIFLENNPSGKVTISSWKDSLIDVSIIHDSSYRGASIMQNMLRGYGVLEYLPIDKPLDLMFDDNKDNNPISGLPGILSRKGIKKPSFYTFKFLKKLDHYFIYKDENVLVTNDDIKYFEIVCHNCKQLSYKYYYAEETGRASQEISDYFEDNDEKRISFRLNGLKNGKYFLKSRTVNEEDGSALHNWLSMDFKYPSFFSRDELDYLNSVSKPSITGRMLMVEDNTLHFDCVLKPNEIKHLHLIYSH